MGQVVQVCGSLLVLAAFALAQRDIVGQKSPWYLILNITGGAVLTLQALTLRQWGFLLLETVWALVALLSLVGVLRRTPAQDQSAGAS